MQGRELAVGWEGRVVSQGREDGPFNSSVLVSFFLTVSLAISPFLCLCLCSVLSFVRRPALQPESPVSHLALQVSAAAGLRGHGLGTPRLPQLAKGGVTILNAGAHPLGVKLTWGEQRGEDWSLGVLWTLPSTPTPGSWGPHLSRSCSEWCGHTSGKPPPRSHP